MMSRLRQLAMVVCVALVFAGNVSLEHLSRFAGETGARSSFGLQCNSAPVVLPQSNAVGGDGGGDKDHVKRCRP